MDFNGSPGRIRNRKEKTRNFNSFAETNLADTPKSAPADGWLFPDTASRYRT
jgi:hypothetical protein